MADKASYRTGIRARGISATNISDTDLDSIIDEALYEFSRWSPIITHRTFETITDQQRYSWAEMGDADGVAVLLCIWNPGATGDVWDLARTMATLGIPRDGGYWHLPSQEMIDQIKAAAWAANYGGSGRQIDSEGGELWLDPTPDESASVVQIIYTKRHTAVTTIPDTARDMFLDLVDSMCADWIANEIDVKGVGSRVRTPEYEIEIADQVARWDRRADTKRSSFVEKAGAGKVACGRT
ncbi:MAG TPA: hypothetical protein VM118_03325 [Acidobacteriota bacterium]|nr:hypothetical protein [Acidobacteriota bacterium]